MRTKRKSWFFGLLSLSLLAPGQAYATPHVDFNDESDHVEANFMREETLSRSQKPHTKSAPAPATAAPVRLGSRPVWHQACRATGVAARSGAVTGSTRVVGSGLHIAEVQDPRAIKAARTQACTYRAVSECGERSDLLYTKIGGQSRVACRYKGKPSKQAPQQRPLSLTEVRTLVSRETKRIRVDAGQVTTDAIKPNTITNAWTNFYLTGSDGDGVIRKKVKVLDEPVTVELTPKQWQYTYGDGNARISRTPGKMLPTRADVWETETPTSHRYTQRGTYTVEAAVTYTGRYSLDNGKTWDTIPGTLDIKAKPLNIRAWTLKAVNVSGPCQPGNPTNDPTCEKQDLTIFKPRQTR
ncbi:hypothetical protein QP228_001335 [Pseudoglutamicibacter cumminsii]|uniref:hypothetical protein n=1 Tax=Pseudoglutamicibacter cumminsii TaxID=156979 RepID=UPI002ABA9437|nr:hypothetical protein [Pseudoglutamicibacter cumminsii]MDZ3744666.1 hypothetical protein [Pseudoglutamicibacter cumminsii]